MVKKQQKAESEKKKRNAQLSNTVKDSAHQIWLAGLGAFAKAQEEGGKVFEALVREGVTLQRKTQAVAEEKITETTRRVSALANDLEARSSGPWDKLETLFEDRVAKALARLGMPSAQELQALNARVEALHQALQASAAVKTDASVIARPARKATPRTAPKTGNKTTATKKAKTVNPPPTTTPRAPTKRSAASKAPRTSSTG